MNKFRLFATLIVVVFSSTMFVANAQQRVQERLNSIRGAVTGSAGGVVINGVRWAQSNVGARSAEGLGNYFSWEQAQNACPAGWRLPTEAELNSLIRAGSTWTTRNGVSGRLFGTAPNQIFLPAAGLSGDGMTFFANGMGLYWSSTRENMWARYLIFDGAGIEVIGNNREGAGISVRCVAR